MSIDSAPITKRFTRWARQKLLHSVTPDGFTKMGEFSADDVFVVGYPKSGNTWFQALMSGAVFGVLPEIVPLSLVQELVPDVHATPWYKRHGKVMFFKSHFLPQPQYRRVIYLLRDGRDAIVSYRHHCQAMERREVDFMEFLHDNKLMYPCPWHEHVKAWSANPFDAQMMTVKYEDLKADPVKELQRVCEFVGMERSTRILELAAESSSFNKMQSKEINEGWHPTKWPKDKLFCRRGQVGSFREEMPREALECFMKDAAPVLQQYGYA